MRYVPTEGDMFEVVLEAQAEDTSTKQFVLALSSLDFNHSGLVKVCSVVPASIPAYSADFVPLPLGMGLPQGFVFCRVRRTIFYKERDAKFVGRVPEDILDTVKSRVARYFDTA